MTSVVIAASFVMLIITGAILFVSPPGRVANWTNWTILSLRKHDWTGLHIWFGVMFLVAALCHMFFNWRPLLNYFKDRLTRRLGFRWEWLVALAICGGVFAGTRASVPPFSTLLSLNERVKRSWEGPRTTAPIPQAELLTLRELSAQAKVPYETAVERLEARGFKGIRPETIVQELAQANQVSAQRVYEVIQGQRGAGRASGGHGFAGAGETGAQAAPREGYGPGGGGGGFGRGGGGGAGRQTLAQYCLSKNIPLTNAAARLQDKGIKFGPDRTLREIALDNGYDRPYAILDIVEGSEP
jgi:hypothetical protein